MKEVQETYVFLKQQFEKTENELRETKQPITQLLNELREAVEAHREHVAQEVLATQLLIESGLAGEHQIDPNLTPSNKVVMSNAKS